MDAFYKFASENWLLVIIITLIVVEGLVRIFGGRMGSDD